MAKFLRWGLLLVVIGGATWFVVNHIPRWKDKFVPRKLRVVEPGRIFASGQIDKGLIRGVLIDDKIKVIVSLVPIDPNNPDQNAERAAAADLGITIYTDPLQGDGTGDITHYADAIQQIVAADQKGKPVLVHCDSGAQRSNGATFYYRVFIEHRDADAAAAEIIANGHDPKSNPMLIPYLNAHMLEMAKLLVQRSVIDRVPEPLPRIHDHD